MPASASPRASTRKARKSIAHLPSAAGSGFDKENQTQILSGRSTQKNEGRGKRSKSIGPGGLEALSESSGNRQRVMPAPRSILKPTIPLSPPKAIPPLGNSQKRGFLELVSATFGNRSQEESGANSTKDKTENVQKVGIKTEEEQQAAAREREIKEAKERRDARRKSLANRRVSFAPEATLHTWDVVEIPEDATSSSEATNSTRRASNGSSLPASPFSGDDGQDGARQSDAQRKKRRNSGIPPVNLNQLEDYSSSPLSSDAEDDTQASVMTADEEAIDDSSSDEDRDLVAREETVTSVDNDDTTVQSVASSKSRDVTDSSDRLDEALRQAAQQANTPGIDWDENGDVSMEIADNEVTNAFQPIMARQAAQSEDIDPFLEMGNGDEGQEMTMEVAQAVGGILSSGQPSASPKRGRRKSVTASRRKSTRRRSSVANTVMIDETMDLTAPVGGIQQAAQDQDRTTESFVGDEDMSMEFTGVVGGVIGSNANNQDAVNDDTLASQQLQTESNQDEVTSQSVINDEMEMTAAVGGILSPVTERTEPEDVTSGMDFTNAFGSILHQSLKTDKKDEAKRLMEEEADHGQLVRSPFKNQDSQEDSTASPSAARRKSKRLSAASPPKSPPVAALKETVSTTPKSESRRTTPMKKPGTPSTQVTPRPDRPGPPSKTPPSKNVSMRKISPKRLFKPEAKDSTPSGKTPVLQFNTDTTGQPVPNVILTPNKRRISGIGIDQEGLGSPRVAKILDRRMSIGEQSGSFTPIGVSGPAVRFQDPRVLEQEINNERAEEARRESGRGIMQMEADPDQEEKDVTTNLRDMIGSLTPKKNKLKGRKSLAVGGGKALLGKRPLELDDEDDEDGTPKRLKGKDLSPVKSVRLPAPPSKEETTGRLGKFPQLNFSASLPVGTPQIESAPTESFSSPKNQTRFKDLESAKDHSKIPVSFNEQVNGVPRETGSEGDDRIELQDFLNLTNIHFMELTATKRRHTFAPSKSEQEDPTLQIEGSEPQDDSRQFPACVVAGASTVPMLELYQHSCRELKKYIAEGRQIVKEIERDTYEENPPLFREYMSASPSIRAIMDNQFKNVKSHARLLSKSMWYEWRMKLLEGLKEGLIKIDSNLGDDSRMLAEQEALLEKVMPGLLKEHDTLQAEADRLQSYADELANCDQDELREAREKLLSVEEEIEARQKQVAELEEQLKEQEAEVEEASARKATCIADIEEAEKICEECRGWSTQEVASLKATVDGIEEKTGWTISSAHGSSVTFTYRKKLSLFVNPSAFAPHAAENSSNSRISLTLDSEDEEDSPDESTSTVLRFFLQLLRARLLCIPQWQTPLSEVLELLVEGWTLATHISAELAQLRAGWQTTAAIAGDESLAVTSTLLLRDMQTKVHAAFTVTVAGQGKAVSAATDTRVAVVYGEELKEDRMADFLATRIAGRGHSGWKGIQGWAEAVDELEARLKARGKKPKN